MSLRARKRSCAPHRRRRAPSGSCLDFRPCVRLRLHAAIRWGSLSHKRRDGGMALRQGWRVPLRSHRGFHVAKWSKKSHLGHRWYRLNGIFCFIWKPYIEDSLCHAPASTFTLRCETMGGIWNGSNGRDDRRSNGRGDGRGGSRCALLRHRPRHRRTAVAATKLRQHSRNGIRIARRAA